MPRHNTTCERCENTFYASPFRKRKGQGRFCSFTCRGLAKQATFEQRFWNRVQKTEGCWLWQGGITPSGYGYSRTHSGNAFAHRLAYQFAFGPIPDGQFICHKCDVRACVRPDRLFVGTTQDNADDMWRKARGSAGEKSPRAKLTQSQVDAIRLQHASGELTRQQLAETYGVTYLTICSIIRKQSWKRT